MTLRLLAMIAVFGVGAGLLSFTAGRHDVTETRTLRVCADPNNLPFSNQQFEGFENKIAELLADEMSATVEYFWWAQRRGFIRNTLKAGECDVVIGVPAEFEMTAVTKPYYRSSYAFVFRRGAGVSYRTFDDPHLRAVRVGVHVIGDDYANTPPVHALAKRGIIRNLVGYRIQGDYREPNPPSEIVKAVARGEVDVAIAWGPTAGYFASRQTEPLTVVPVTPEMDSGIIPMTYAVSMGVRHDDQELLAELQQILDRRRGKIRQILTEYDVPLLNTRGGD